MYAMFRVERCKAGEKEKKKALRERQRREGEKVLPRKAGKRERERER